MIELLRTLGSAARASPLLPVPAPVIGTAAPSLKAALIDTSTRLPSQRARDKASWQPAHVGIVEGLPAVVQLQR
ncbi:MAG TPA: hypothetical protein VKY90_08540 [Candidatus Dormibacteraeota bacterium]|nr:hypothetical protein [Candidatus Dormibacteraeota bacterium]